MRHDRPAGSGRAGRATLAAMGWMATWWMTKAVAIEVTALLPIALFPLAAIMPLGRTTANYGADVIYLFLGGFVLALAIARWGLDRRIAFMTLRLVVTPPNAIVFGTGLVRMPDMMKAGLWLNLTGMLLIFALTYSVFIAVLGLLR